MSTVKGPNEEIATTLEQKEALFLATAFPIPQENNIPEPIIPLDEGTELIIEETISDALFS